MPTIRFGRQAIELRDEQSVLGALLGAGCDIPNSCRAGACQSCLMQAVQGTPPVQAQEGLKDTLKADGFFLACQCHPIQDLEVALDPSKSRVPATIAATELLAEGILRVRVEPNSPFSYRSGQYLTLWLDGHTARSYSLASVPELDGEQIILHVKRMPGGILSGWLFDRAKAGNRVEIQGPMGSCFYLPGEPQSKLMLVGTGTGLAPLYGILRDALNQGHEGDIHLLHGALIQSGLYLHDEMTGLAARHSNFHYHPCVLNDSADANRGIETAAVDRKALELAPELKSGKAYLCGPPELVNGLRKKLFLAGMSLGRIYADPFLPGAP